MATATYQVKIAWDSTPDNAFCLNSSQLNSARVLTSQYSSSLDLLQFDISTFGNIDIFSSEFSGLYSEISSYVKGISIKRGRDDNLSDFAAGEAVITLNDTTGRFSPLNTASPLYPYVVPGRGIVIEATFNGTVYPLFRGFVRSIEYNPASSAQETIIHAQDFFLFLSRAKPTIAATGSTTTGAAIRTILTSLNWTDTNYISLETGDTINAGISGDGNTTALALIENLIETERGEFFQSASGVVTYKARSSRYLRTSSSTLTDVAASGIASIDLTNIKNRAVVKNGAYVGTATDYPSSQNYGFSDFGTIDSTNINTQIQAQSLAEWLVSQGKNPKAPLRSLSFPANISGSLMTTVLTRDLGDRITVNDSSLDTTADFYIEGIDTKITAGQIHEVSYTLSRVPTNKPLVFGTTRVRPNGEFGSPTLTSSPWDTVNTNSDVFAY